MTSIAGHHPECPYPLDDCLCIELHARDDDEWIEDDYARFMDNDEREGWPYVGKDD